MYEEEERIKYASEALLSFKNGLPTKIKEEPMEEEFGPASLGLHRIGDALPPKPQGNMPALNRRGMPARIRKKNKLFFDDEVTPDTVVPKSMLKTTRVKSPGKRGRKPKEPNEQPPAKLESGDRKLGQKIGMRLRNLLKLPKAHKWVCYEWFYSNIDSALFSGDNDFMICLKESFPQLKTNMLTRVEWCIMRRMMGKPRRCSQAFFEEERRELDRKRSKIRQLQQRKPTDLNSCKDLPPEIPLQLVIGTKVTARLRSPQDGLFTGSVDAFDTSNDTYRITFERPGLGTHSIPDFEVLSNEPIDTISVTSMVHALRPTKPQSSAPAGNEQPYSGQNDARSDNSQSERNGFPTSVLENIVKLGKLLEIKRIKVNILRDMNVEAERKKCHSQPIPEEFVKKYASNIVELEHVNTMLRDLLSSVQNHCQELLPNMNMAAVMTPNYLRNQSLDEAKAMVNRFNPTISDPILDLVIELTALMIQVKSLSESDRSSFEVEVLSTSMDIIKKKLSPANKTVFESCVEVHMRHIQSGLSGEIGAFSMVTPSRP
ncbi:protein lin-9 homolog isoform X2 [Cimex lectularius]|uniref:DIRP domain-containing protein n=1 Tax=Cimex lectularius TaxID=79782 RepID=A0A8I6RAX3_CIMLE|nr:protein lin-9 homolog isoform X2 [Cimex lectularius]XP_014241127.1 protein lin-9 homolog isoform X2 [Cimex lectularius]XP_014241128.1 protein lin-9 homolog isoform X2 [Cimex lectularius]